MAIVSPAAAPTLAWRLPPRCSGCASNGSPVTDTSMSPPRFREEHGEPGHGQPAPASGSLVSGTLTPVPMGNGVHMTGEVGGLKPGDMRGFHIHEKALQRGGRVHAGGHFNPASQAHGRSGHGAHHAGTATTSSPMARYCPITPCLRVTLGGVRPMTSPPCGDRACGGGRYTPTDRKRRRAVACGSSGSRVIATCGGA